MKKVAVTILAGGQGRRIGGAKPFRLLGDRRLIERAIDLARLWSDTVAVAVRDLSQAPSPDVEVIQDEAIEGPLGGLAAALKFARTKSCPLLLTIPADMPFLPADLLDRLADAIANMGCAIASSGGHAHPVCGLWHTSAVGQLDDYVFGGGRSLKGFAKLLGGVKVEWPAGAQDPFFNINSAEDLAEAEKRLL